MMPQTYQIPEVNDKLLLKMTQAVVDAVAPERIILFGSRALGTAHTYSDIDLLIIKSQDFGPGHGRRQESAKVSWVLSEFGVPADILMYHSDEIDEWKNSPNHVIYRALTEGQVLYERSEAGESFTRRSLS